MASLYLDESLAPEAFAVGQPLVVGGGDARHATQVARVRVGERIGVGDGRGRIGWGSIIEIVRDAVVIEVDAVDIEESDRPEVWLVQALAKGDRDELAVQAATELGVAGVIPWQAARSVSRWSGPKAAKGAARWRSIAREAAKQAIRATVPAVGALASTSDLARRTATPDALAIVLEPTAAASLRELVETSAIAGLARIDVLVGPEGGIDPAELRQLELAGARPARLGPTVLRTSTAGPAAIAALDVLLGRW